MKAKIKIKGNPFAICRAMKKKKGWGTEKYERCVKKIKKSRRK